MSGETMQEFCKLLRFGATLGMGLLGAAMAQAETVIKIGSAAELSAALETLSAETVLELAAGDYGSLALRGKGGRAEAPVVLRSAESANPARFSAMDLRDVSHLVLENLVFDYTYSADQPLHYRPFAIANGENITLRDNRFDGDTATGLSQEDDGSPTGIGLGLRDLKGAVLEGNELHTFYRGLVITQSQDLVLRGNEIHSIRSDGMNFAQVQNILIEDNLIRDFRRQPNANDHADMIQFWTNGTTAPSRAITIRNNVLNSGNGLFTQSIFMRNELVDSGRAGEEMFYRDVTIEGNVIINAHLHGISLGETAGLSITNNSLLRNARSEGKQKNPGLWTPQIRVAPNSTQVTIARNVTSQISGYAQQPDWQVSDNLLIQDRSPGQSGYYDQIFQAARTGDPSDLASFAPVAGGPLDGRRIGAPRLDPKAAQPSTTSEMSAVARILANPEIRNRFRFEGTVAGLPADLPAEDLVYAWDLGDGATAQGASVEHLYSATGPLEVVLTVTLPDGKTLSVKNQIIVAGALVLHFSSETGEFVSYAERDPVVVDGLSLGRGPAVLGQGVAPVVIPAAQMAPFFQSTDFELALRIRGMPSSRSAGEMLRVHPAFIVTVTERGLLDIVFKTENAEAVRIKTSVVPLYSKDWVDLVFAYSAMQQRFTVTANGRVVGQARIFGQIRPQEYWGLSLGNPFAGRKSFDGELAELTLKVGQETYSASVPEAEQTGIAPAAPVEN